MLDREIEKEIRRLEKEKKFEKDLQLIKDGSRNVKKALKKANIPNGFLRVFVAGGAFSIALAFALNHENKKRLWLFKRKNNKVRIFTDHLVDLHGTLLQFFDEILARSVPDKYSVVNIADRPDVIADKWQKGKTNIAILVNPKEPVEKIENYDRVYCIEI